MKRSRFFVGLMSGTSADGIDAAVVALSRTRQVEVVAHVHRGFPPALRRRILHTCTAGTVAEICALNFLLGGLLAEAARAVLRQAGLRSAEVTAIGSHGQTIHHLPRANPPSTLQIGEPSVIAERVGITTIADFRVRDMAAGGQGAPLVPLADWLLFSDPLRPRIIQNIGGIANLTWLPAGGPLESVRAFDTGPGNMVLDALASHFSGGREGCDLNGARAARGTVSAPLLARLMAHPFLRRRPPKTTGREEFGPDFVARLLASGRRMRLRPEDMLATATAFTARSIAAAYKPLLEQVEAQRQQSKSPLQVILGGGGTKNRTLVRMLRQEIASVEILTHEDFGIPSEAKEAVAFALLAARTIDGQPGNVPGATGARRPVVLGKVVPA